MTYNPEIQRRRSIRAKGYDYARPGAYFVTICTWGREPILGDVVDGAMHVDPVGAYVADVWNRLPGRFAGVAMDAFVAMPNHVHGIVMLGTVDPPSLGVGRPGRACPARFPNRRLP